MRSALPSRLALVAALLLPSLACRPAADKAASTEKKAPASAEKPKKKSKPKPKDGWLDEVIAGAEVTVRAADGTVTPCVYDGAKKRHRCEGLPSWLYVGPQVLRVGGGESYCAWQHPISGGKVTTKLKGVAQQPLEFAHAFTGNAAKVEGGAPVDAVLRVDGEERAKLRRERAPGFARAALEPAAEGKPGDLEVEVSTTHDGAAHYCWRLTRKPAKEVKRASAKEVVAPANKAKVQPAAKPAD